MDLNELQRRALRIHDLYDELNLRERGRTWTREEFMLGFVGDVGDLAKIVMAQEGARDMPGGRAALEHELADCLWSVLILAHRYDVDLNAAFLRTMDGLNQSITAQGRRDASQRERGQDDTGPDRLDPGQPQAAEVGLDAADEPSDSADLVVGGHGLTASPIVGLER
ncbi:hypothetical protein ABT126_39120 [Streptomyces sp. NPDC002012]|uniref:hypothetical protein n=1 Tax=unclassified Streptomyces TaxID=2593676 RepID=UPI002E0E0288